MKARKLTAHSCIDSRGQARVCLCTSQPWKAVLSLKVEAIQYAIIWIIDDWFLSNQCPHKTMHSLALPWWRERARPVFVPVPLAKGKSFNALKPLAMLQLKDSPWNQLGWCVFPYDGGLSEWPSSKWGREGERHRHECSHIHLDASAHLSVFLFCQIYTPIWIKLFVLPNRNVF